MVSIISGRFKGRRLQTASGPGYRPATSRVRESLFSILQSLDINWPKTSVLDLFAGSGALGLEALSRGAGYVLWVEKNKKVARVIRENLRLLHVPGESGRVLTQDVFYFLARTPPLCFQLVFIDPPYQGGYLDPALKGLVRGGWLADGALVQAETEADLETPRFEGLDMLREKIYGQTRVCIWKKRSI
ncbi:MAG: 16S rRNA (guanine(966)-N(2))-methyltransferase RsmD [Desulfonatronovibrionaceae bacterium]